MQNVRSVAFGGPPQRGPYLLLGLPFKIFQNFEGITIISIDRIKHFWKNFKEYNGSGPQQPLLHA